MNKLLKITLVVTALSLVLLHVPVKSYIETPFIPIEEKFAI